MERQQTPFELRLIHAMRNSLFIGSPGKKRVERVDASPEGLVEFDLFDFDTTRVESWAFRLSDLQLEAFPVYDITVKQPPTGYGSMKHIADAQLQIAFFGNAIQ